MADKPKTNFFTVRLSDSEYKLLTDLSRDKGVPKSEVFCDALRSLPLVPDLPDFYVSRLERIARSRSSLSVSILIKNAVVEKWGEF